MEEENHGPLLWIMDSSSSWTRGKGDTGHFWRCRLFFILTFYWV